MLIHEKVGTTPSKDNSRCPSSRVSVKKQTHTQIHACTHSTYTCIYTLQVFIHVYKLKLSLYPTEGSGRKGGRYRNNDFSNSLLVSVYLLWQNTITKETYPGFV